VSARTRPRPCSSCGSGAGPPGDGPAPTHRLVTCVLGLAAAVTLCAIPITAARSAFAAAPELTRDAPDRDWRAGPIRYILTVKEDHQYKALKTDAERAAFIATFWAALDPTPGTPENERREEFWRRVEEAGRLFREPSLVGWRTDRGKFFILLGPPDERVNRVSEEIWKYVALPNPGGDPEVSMRFRRNSDGNFNAGRDALEYWDPAHESDGPAAGETFLAVRTKKGTREMMKGRIRMTEFPQTVVTADEFTAPLDAHLRLDVRRAGPGKDRVIVTLAAPPDPWRGAGDAAAPAPDMWLAVFVDDAKKGEAAGSHKTAMRLVGPAAAGSDRPLIFQGSFTIAPGAYRATLTIVERKSRCGLTHSAEFTAPDFGRRLALGSIALGRLRDGDGAPGAPLIPEPMGDFRPEDTLLFVYEVYNAEAAEGSPPDLDVTYEFMVDSEGGPRPAGAPIILRHQSSTALAYGLSLRGWPAAGYRLRVRVTDNRSGATVEEEAAFRIAGGTTPGP
jgi:GWxTD domain-containing protein